MNEDYIKNAVIESAADRRAIHVEINNLKKRIDDNDKLTQGVHDIAANVAVLAEQIKQLGERMDKSLMELNDRMDEKDGKTNEWLKELEVKIENNKDSIYAKRDAKQEFAGIYLRLGEIEKKPAKKWEQLSAQILSIIIAAIAAFVLARFGLS